MIPPTKLPITGGKGEPEEVKGTKDPHALSIGTSTDKESQKKFKDVLDVKEKTRTPKAKSQVSDDDEKLSPLDLAKTLARPTKTPSIAGTAVFRQAAEEEKPAIVAAGYDTDVEQEAVPAQMQSMPKEKETAAASEVDVPKETAGVQAPPAKDKKTDDVAQSTQVITSTQPQVVLAAAPVQAQKPVQDNTQIRQNLIQMASQMIESLKQIKAPDRTETTLTLNNSGMFNGTEIKITEYNSSKGQFNVTFNFTNTQDTFARQLVQMPLHQQRLQQALAERGYVLQQISFEEKISGLKSTDTGDVEAQRQRDDEAESATDQDAGAPA